MQKIRILNGNRFKSRIVEDGKVTEVPKFKSPIVKVNVKDLENKDKLAVYYLKEQDNTLEL